MTEIANHQLVSQIQGNIVSDMDGEKVMLSIHNGKYFNLGEVGGKIWDLMEEPISVPDIVQTLLDQFNVDQTECYEHVTKFLSQLSEQGLIKIEDKAV